MVEIPRKNGKRRYFCKSLHTTNYYEVQERAKIMVKSLNSSNIEVKTYIHVAQSIINKLKFDEHLTKKKKHYTLRVQIMYFLP